MRARLDSRGKLTPPPKGRRVVTLGRRSLACVMASALWFSGSLQAQGVFIRPALPAELLKAFPPVPAQWKVLQASGKSGDSVMDTPITSAIRKYEVPRFDPKTG